MEQSLTLGSLLLTDSTPDADHGFVFNVLAEGMGFGVASGVQEVVRSLLADGDLVRITRFGNREVTFRVEVSGPTLDALNNAEAALRREMYRPNELTWQAPDIMSAPTVFDVVTSEMQQRFDDLDELRAKRTFDVSLTCQPFARSATPVTVPAVSIPSTSTSSAIDSCDSATGWSAAMNGVPAGVSTTWEPGAVSVVDLGAPTPSTLTLTRTGSVNFSSERYLVIEVGYNAWLGAIPVSAYAGSSTTAPELAKVSQQQIGSGWFRCIYDTGGATLAAVTFAGTFRPINADLKIRQVSKQNQPGGILRQQSRIIETGGTERTPASLHVYSQYDLGNMQVAIVHTCPEDGSGYSPPLRRWRVTGNAEVASEGDTLSTKREALKPNSVTCEVPNPALPTGGYVFAARLQSSVTTQVGIDWAVHTFFSADGGPEEGVVSGTMPWTPKGVSQWEIVPLAMLTLPTVWGVGGMTRVSFRCLAADADVFWDEAFLFRADDDCALTIMSEPPDHIWLDAAGISGSSPRVQQGYSADRTDARHPGSRLLASGNHVLHPEGTTVFSAAITNQLLVDASYYRRWHSNAAE